MNFSYPLSYYYQVPYPTLPQLPTQQYPKLIYDSRFEIEDKYYRNQIINQQQQDQHYANQEQIKLNITLNQKNDYIDSSRYNQINDHDIRLIAYFINEEIQFRKELVIINRQLKKTNPNLLQLFSLFTNEKYKIEQFTFIDVLQTYQEDVKVCDVELLFNYLNNWKRCQTITYGQFLQLIIPYIKYEQMPDPQDLKYQQDQPSEEQIKLICRLIITKLQMMSTQEYFRQRIEKSLINLVQIFEYIDQDRDGWIKGFEIVKLLQTFNYLVTVEETSIMLQDIDERAQINLQQFLFYYKPKSLAVYL